MITHKLLTVAFPSGASFCFIPLMAIKGQCIVQFGVDHVWLFPSSNSFDLNLCVLKWRNHRDRPDTEDIVTILHQCLQIYII